MKKKKKETTKKIAEKSQKNDADTAKRVRIKVIGIGGGGGNIIAELLKKLKDFSSQKVEFVA